jgi:hypothetical protein
MRLHFPKIGSLFTNDDTEIEKTLKSYLLLLVYNKFW